MTAAAPMDRPHALDRLGTTRFDVLVVGGGITGAGVARDAALRGLRVALVDADDFASGTSSRSSRLVHGGVRYLEHGHLGLVFEASRERTLLLQLAPHLVRPLAFTWPVYRGARVPRWKLFAGLWLYDALAGFRRVSRHQRLGSRAVEELEPQLDRAGLAGGARYWDAATDDARLTLANAIAAAEADATVVNHCAVNSLLHSGGRVSGATVVDRFSGQQRTVRADVVVNAAGPWAGELLEMDDGEAHEAVRGTKGVHLLVPRERVGNRGAVTLVSSVDGRVMFVLPAGGFTLVGTTDTRTAAEPGEVRGTAADVDYLLRSVNAAFPAAALTTDDVISVWAGIRPLMPDQRHQEPGAEGKLSREHALYWSATHMLTIVGGKLTTYRAMAEEVVDAVVASLHRRAGPPLTGRQPLPGGDIDSVEAESARALPLVLDDDAARHLVLSYGSRWRRVWNLTSRDRRLRERLTPELPYLAAEVVHAADRELACTIGDVLIRRTKLAFELRDHGLALAGRVARLLAPSLGWSGAAEAQHVAAYEAEMTRIFTVERDGASLSP